MSKHTPGPWKADRMFNPPKAKNRTSGFIVNGPETGELLPDRICDMRVPPGLRFREFEANARLIAAAPELLEALIACLRDCESTEEIHPRSRITLSLATRQQALAAIQKATTTL